MYKNNLVSIGITANLRGFHYLNRLLELYGRRDKLDHLYLIIADEFSTKPSTVESAVRAALSNGNIHKNLKTPKAFISTYKFVIWSEVLLKNKEYENE